MHNINPIIKKLINKHFDCETCEERNYCKFWKGYNMPCDCVEGCFAEETAEGIQIAFEHLANIPWNEVRAEIMKVVISDKNKSKNG